MAAISRSNLLKELLPAINDLFGMEYDPVDIPNINEIKSVLNNWRTGKDHWSKFNTDQYGHYESWWGDTMDKIRAEKWYPVVWAIKQTTNDHNVTAAVAALIAHPECGYLMGMPPNGVRLMRESGYHEAKLLYPAICLLNGVEP